MFMIVDRVKKEYVYKWEAVYKKKIRKVYSTPNAHYGLVFSSKQDVSNVVDRFWDKERYKVIEI